MNWMVIDNKPASDKTSSKPKSAWAAHATQRNKGFDATHKTIIHAAIQLVAEKAVGTLSVAKVARSIGVDRKTFIIISPIALPSSKARCNGRPSS